MRFRQREKGSNKLKGQMKERTSSDERQKNEKEDGFGGRGKLRCGKWGENSSEGKGRKGSINCISKHVSIVTDW